MSYDQISAMCMAGLHAAVAVANACYRAKKSGELPVASRALNDHEPCSADLRLCCALLAAATPATAQEAKGTACVAGSKAAPARVIADCDALLTDKATPDAKAADIFLARAEAHVRQGRLQLAIEDLDNAIKRSPADARLFAQRAELYRQIGEHERSLTDSNEAIRLDPGKADVFRGRGNAYHQLQQFDRAIEDYTEALRLDPKNAQAFSDRGAAWYFKKEPQAAIGTTTKRVRLEPANPYVLSNRAAAWKDLGEMDRALRDEFGGDPHRSVRAGVRGATAACRMRGTRTTTAPSPTTTWRSS